MTLLPSGAGLLVDPAEPHGVGALFRFSAREPLNRVGAKAVSSLASASTLFWSANIDHALVVLRQSARPLPFDAGWRTPEDWDQVPGALLRVRPKPTGAGPSPRRHGNA
ncbi:hypothetical protein CU254_23260 [Amycolatopsis sp. AA4]|nr:hypothetical protein CU254_23260 [Amycolatopsis sp. AA4]